jgi:hypothetical protein
MIVVEFDEFVDEQNDVQMPRNIQNTRDRNEIFFQVFLKRDHPESKIPNPGKASSRKRDSGPVSTKYQHNLHTGSTDDRRLSTIGNPF